MKPHVMIVDDQAEVRLLLRMALRSDFELTEYSNGEIAFTTALTRRPALILLDVMMPGSLNGLEICAKLRSAPSMDATRIVLLSARAQESDIEAGYKAGADVYITKPFSPLDLLCQVRELIARPGPAQARLGAPYLPPLPSVARRLPAQPSCSVVRNTTSRLEAETGR